MSAAVACRGRLIYFAALEAFLAAFLAFFSLVESLGLLDFSFFS